MRTRISGMTANVSYVAEVSIKTLNQLPIFTQRPEMNSGLPKRVQPNDSDPVFPESSSSKRSNGSASPTRATLLLAVRDLENVEAWGQFVEIYTPLIYGHCLRRGLQPADASDVTQETMRALARALQHFEYDRSKGAFRSWLLTVTRSKLNTFFTRQNRAPQPVGETELNLSLDQQAANAADSENQRWEQEYRTRLYEWAASQVQPQFQPVTWQAFTMTTFQHLPTSEVSQRLKISSGAVYIAKCRVAAKLREKILEATEDEGFWD